MHTTRSSGYYFPVFIRPIGEKIFLFFSIPLKRDNFCVRNVNSGLSLYVSFHTIRMGMLMWGGGGCMTTATCWMWRAGGSVFSPVAVIDPLLEKSLKYGGVG